MDIFIYISLHTLNMLFLKILSLKKNPIEMTLIMRGVGCITMSIIFALKMNFSLLPKRPKLQFIRLCIAGLGLALIISSYQYVHASTVAVLLKFDVIFLIFISAFLGHKTKNMTYYALGAFVLLFIHISLFKGPTEDIFGHVMALVGTFIISIGFLLLNKSGKSENKAVTCLIPGLSLFLFGLLLAVKNREDYIKLITFSSMLACLSGVIMFAIYIYTLKLYNKHSVVFTELLTFICIFIFIPIEIWGLKIFISTQHLLSILIVSLYTLFVFLKREKVFA